MILNNDDDDVMMSDIRLRFLSPIMLVKLRATAVLMKRSLRH